MDAGKLNKRITIQRRNIGETPSGQPVEQWTDLCTIWAQMECKDATAVSSDGMIQHESVYNFYIRYRTDIIADDRVVYNGRIFKLLADPVDWTTERFGLTLKTREYVK